MRRSLRDETGVSLVMVAFAILVLTGFLAFVLDNGVIMLGRTEAQRAADAGALAGAISRAFDETTNPPSADGLAYQAAVAGANGNPGRFGTWGDPVVSWECPVFAAGQACVRVDVHADGESNSQPLPVFFAGLLGQTEQRTRATATAIAGIANAVDCLRPFAVPDKFVNVRAPDDEYNRYKTTNPGKGSLLPTPDLYTPPSASGPGTGYTVALDYGTELTLRYSPGAGGGSGPRPGWFSPIDVPRTDGTPSQGGARFRANIASCNGSPVEIGDYLPTETGAMQGPTFQGLADLFDLDRGAMWNDEDKRIEGSCAPACGSFSPRIIALAVYDTELWHYSDTRTGSNGFSYCPGGGSCVKVVNFIGFFVDRVEAGEVIGYLIRYPGLFAGDQSAGPPLTPSSAFTTVISLIR